jgi:hypothetical protein
MVDVRVTVANLPDEITIDDDAIQKWISTRLNAARNIFIRQLMRGAGGGRIYRRHGHAHQASAPGEYPVTDRGGLAASVEWEITGDREGRLLSDLNYAAWLTTGTTRMAPRKMLDAALKEALVEAGEEDVLAQAVKVTT